MISDPKTTPDARIGRIVFALLVALAALYVQFGFFKPNGPLWALIVCSPLVPLIDWMFPGTRYEWSKSSHGTFSVPVSAPLLVPSSFSQPRRIS